MNLPDLLHIDERNRAAFQRESLEALDDEYRQLDMRIAGYLDAMQRELERILEGDD